MYQILLTVVGTLIGVSARFEFKDPAIAVRNVLLEILYVSWY